MAKKKKKKGTPVDPDAWMVTFSDLMTLLLTFFVLLLTMKSMDTKALKSMFSVFPGAVGMFGFGEKTIMGPSAVMPPRLMRVDAETLRSLLQSTKMEIKDTAAETELAGGGGEEKKGKAGGLGGGGAGSGAGKTEGALRESSPLAEGDQYGSVEADVNDIIDFAIGKESGTGGETAVEKPDLKDITVLYTTRGLVVRFPNEVLFASGSAKISPRALPLLERIGNFIVEKKYKVEIEGHTDNVPIHTPEFPSNWELSTTRAVNVLRFLLARFKIPSEDVSALGFGDKKPLVPNVSEEQRAKNRRVVMILYRED